jgi:hypothetical protein
LDDGTSQQPENGAVDGERVYLKRATSGFVNEHPDARKSLAQGKEARVTYRVGTDPNKHGLIYMARGFVLNRRVSWI